MAYILNIETSTTNCSVALAYNGEVIGFKEDNSSEYSHAERLHVYIDQVLKTTQISIDQLEAIAISKGPGSYTGLRIGVSAAKGLCFALNIPLIAINTLQSLAESISKPKDSFIIPLIDARRMEVYALVLNAQKEVLQATEAVIVTPDSFQEFQSQGRLVLFGNGATKCKDVIPLTNSLFVEELQFPSARNMVALATAKFEANSIEDVAYFEPFYLKDFYTNMPKR